MVSCVGREGTTSDRPKEWWRASARRSWSGGELKQRSWRRRRPRGTARATGPCGGVQWTGEWRWGARRGEREGEAFGVELAEDIGEREVGGARGHKKLRRSRNPVAVRGGRNNSGAGGERGSDRSW
jgi:hypothetical protein